MWTFKWEEKKERKPFLNTTDRTMWIGYILVVRKNAVSVILNRKFVLKTVCELFYIVSHYSITTTSKESYYPHFADKIEAWGLK